MVTFDKIQADVHSGRVHALREVERVFDLEGIGEEGRLVDEMWKRMVAGKL